MYLELRDAFVGPVIVEGGGITYLAMPGFATIVGLGLPVLGAVWGAKNLPSSLKIWRWTLGLTGVVLAGFALYGGYGFLESAYYDYYLFPRVKAEDHYIMPLRWQDVVARVLIGSILIGLLVLAAHLLRSAFRPRLEARQKLS